MQKDLYKLESDMLSIMSHDSANKPTGKFVLVDRAYLFVPLGHHGRAIKTIAMRRRRRIRMMMMKMRRMYMAACAYPPWGPWKREQMKHRMSA
jgi:hypothetical protein